MIEKWVIFKRNYLEISFLRENCGYDGSDERRRCVYITTFFIHTYRQGNAYKHALTHRCTVAHICHNNTSIVDIQLTYICIPHIQTLPILNKSSCYIYNAQSLITLRNTLTQRKYTQATLLRKCRRSLFFFLDNALHFISARVGCFPPGQYKRHVLPPPPPLIGLSENKTSALMQ